MQKLEDRVPQEPVDYLGYWSDGESRLEVESTAGSLVGGVLCGSRQLGS